MEGEGTVIKEEIDLENNLIVRGIAFERDIVRITVMYDVPYNGSLANIFTALAEHHINVDIIVQTIMEGVQPSVSFSIKKEDFAEVINVLETNRETLGYRQADFEVGLAKVSIVGSGMVSNPGVAATDVRHITQCIYPCENGQYFGNQSICCDSRIGYGKSRGCAS